MPKQEITELIQTHDTAIDYFAELFEQGYENQRFLRGIHWTDKQKKQHHNEKRHPYAITLTATKFNRHLAEQRSNRTSWKSTGRGEEDELQAELDTQAFKYVEDINGFKYTESEIYTDALGKKYGVLVVSQDYDNNPQGDVKLERWKFDQCVWDVNSTSYDLNKDCTFIDRFEWYTREQIEQMYPSSKKKARFTPASFENDTVIKRNIKNYYFKDKGKDRIKVIWRQQKEYKKVYKAIPLKPDIEIKEFDTQKEAEAHVYQQAIMMAGLQDASQLATAPPEVLNAIEQLKSNFRIVDVMTQQVREICWTATEILEDKIIDWTNKYTVIPYFALKDDEYIFNLIDLVKDPQRGFDRLFSMIDKSIAKNIKGNNYTIDETKVRPEVLASLDVHKKNLVEGGAMIPVLDPTAIQPLGSQNNITIEMTLIQMMQSLIEDLMGGNAFQGVESKTKQTATEASLLEKSARLGTFLFIDNLMRWKQLAGEVIYDCILNTYGYEMKMGIAGDVLGKKIQEALSNAGIFKMSDNIDGQGYLTYNKGGQRLRQNKMNVIVTEVETSETTKAMQYQQLTDYSAQMVQMGAMPAPPEILLSSSNLPATVKVGMQKYYEEQMQAQAQQAQETHQMEMAKLNAEIIDKVGGKLNEANKPKENAHNKVQ